MAEYTDITPMLQCTPGLQRQAWLSTAMITTAMATQSLEHAGERALVHDFNHLVSPRGQAVNAQSSGMCIPLQNLPCLMHLMRVNVCFLQLTGSRSY